MICTSIKSFYEQACSSSHHGRNQMTSSQESVTLIAAAPV